MLPVYTNIVYPGNEKLVKAIRHLSSFVCLAKLPISHKPKRPSRVLLQKEPKKKKVPLELNWYLLLSKEKKKRNI